MKSIYKKYIFAAGFSLSLSAGIINASAAESAATSDASIKKGNPAPKRPISEVPV